MVYIILLLLLLLLLTGAVLFALRKRRDGGEVQPEEERMKGRSEKGELAWTILGYTSAQSVYPGDTLAFHVRLGDGASGGQFRINIYRVGTGQQSVLSEVGK